MDLAQNRTCLQHGRFQELGWYIHLSHYLLSCPIINRPFGGRRFVLEPEIEDFFVTGLFANPLQVLARTLSLIIYVVHGVTSLL
ncbi:MAG: hypothetical protein OJF52_000283 [Nitrospira sp.]|nr:MAG: hypothetical protein OJF52_000283 [Nitrospira sp.]